MCEASCSVRVDRLLHVDGVAHFVECANRAVADSAGYAEAGLVAALEEHGAVAGWPDLVV